MSLRGGRRQQPLTDLRIGNNGDAAEIESLPESLVVTEDKQAVFLQRPAQCAAELVSAERRSRKRLIEEIPRIEVAVAEEFEDRAMECIGSGLS